MIDLVIAMLIVGGIIKLLERKNENSILDFGEIFALLLAPALLALLIGLGLKFTHLPDWVGLLPTLLFFIVPFLMLKYAFSYSTKRSMLYAGIFLGVVVVMDVLFIIIAAVIANQ